jgi:LemA protein
VQQFPANLIAGPFGFTTEEFYEVSDDEREAMKKAPDVSFGS